MKITFEVSGGFAPIPAFSKLVTVDTAQIDQPIAAQLQLLIQQSHFFEQPAQVDTTVKGAADYQTYTITVEDDGQTHTVQLTDPITDANLERLVTLLQNFGRPSLSQ